MHVGGTLLVLFAIATPAAAQSTYVGGSVIGEFARYGGADVDDDARVSAIVEPLSRSWETMGFDLRVGRSLGERWGVEFSYARGGSHEQSRTQRILPFLTSSPAFDPTTLIRTLPTLPTLPLPDFEFELSSEQQHTTFDTVVWLRQELADRVDLVFLGGASFNRVEMEQNVSIGDIRLALSFPATEIETVTYGVGPVVGTEAVIEFSDHAGVTGGVRLHGVSGGWLIRPSLGLRWSF